MVTFHRLGINAQERLALSSLKGAMETARDRNSVTLGDRNLLEFRNAARLSAASPHARVLWGDALYSSMFEILYLDVSDLQFFWITLVHTGCSTAYNEPMISFANFIRQFRKALKGLSYIAILEPAYYVNVTPGTNFRFRSGVYWHVHAICWNTDRKQMKKRIARLNADKSSYRPITDKYRGAHYAEIPSSSIARKMGYGVKSPRVGYRVSSGEGQTKFGEIVKRYRQRKSKLRPGERLRLFHLLKRTTLDALTFAGGEGSLIRRRALRGIKLPENAS